MCRTRTVSLFTQGLFTNPRVWYGGVLSIAIAFVFIYVFPGGLFGTAPLSLVSSFTLNLAFLAVALPYTEGVKYMLRRHPNSFIARRLAW